MFLPAELLVFLGTWVSSLFILGWWNDHRKVKPRYPPSLPSLPLVGSLPFLRGFNNIAEFFMRKADELGPIFTFRAGSKVVLILNSRDVIQDALVNHSSSFSGRFLPYSESVINPNSKGLISINTTPEWKKYHQLSLSILKELGFGVKSMMESRILTEVAFMTDYILKQLGNSLNPRELVHLCAKNIIMNIIFGRRQDYDLGMTELGNEVGVHYANKIDVALAVAPILRFVPFHRNKLHRLVEIQKLVDKSLASKTEKSLEDGADDCFVRRYVESIGPGYDTEQLRFTVRDMIAAGTDTTATTLLFTLIALANNPDVQDRLRAEIDAAVPRDALPSMNDQLKMPFVEATMLEILRWRILIPFAPRETLSDTSVGDYFVPKKTVVLVNLYAAHLDPKVWKDPEIFRPERFLDKDGQVFRRESVIPFSLGRRSCLGEVLARAELFLILTGLVQRFIIRPPEGQSVVDDKPIEPVGVTLEPAKFNIRLIARK